MRSTADIDEAGARTAPVGGVVGTAFTAATLEWYTLFLYGTAAAFVFNRLFFPTTSPLRGTLLALSTYSAGLLARPVGGVVFGQLGDRHGRKPALVRSLLVTGVATVLIGCLPSAARIGVSAPVLLVLLHFAQGLGVGGGWGATVLLAVEDAPSRTRGWNGAWPQAGAYAGLLASTVVVVVAQAVTSEAQFVAWGWRLPFLAGASLLVMAWYLQRHLSETSVFARTEPHLDMQRAPILEVIRSHPRELLLATGMRAGESASLYVFAVFLLTYGPQRLGIPRPTMLAGVVLATLVGLASTPLFGWLSDRLGRRPVSLAGAAGLLLVSLPFFSLVETRSRPLIWLAVVVAVNVAHDLLYGPQAAWFSELFATASRYSGVSVATQLGSLLGGGLAPLLAVWALDRADVDGVVVYAYAVALLAFVCAWFAPETLGSDLDADLPR